MKNYSKWVLAATLICSICVISACDEKEKEIINDNQLATRILGKWIPVQSNGMEVMTDQKTVTTFKKTSSGLKAYTSVSSLVMPAQFQDPSKETVQTDEWHYNQPADVNIEENKFIITRAVNDTINQISKYYILESSDSTLELYISTRLSINGNEIMSSMGHTETWAKVNVDYSKEIVGLWEGHVTSDTSKYDDGETHRWRYNIDGTYIYYSQDQTGEWVEVESVFNNYFVDGYLLCTRWKNVGENENREWWEIDTIGNDSMRWTAQRIEYEYASGPSIGITIAIPRQYTATFSMSKVSERK